MDELKGVISYCYQKEEEVKERILLDFLEDESIKKQMKKKLIIKVVNQKMSLIA